jgi:hypothetical protein
VAVPWWSSRDLPLPRSSSVLHPVSPEPLHETTLPKLPHSVRLTTGSRGVPILPPNHCPFSTSPQNLAPAPRKLQPNQSRQRSSYVPEPFSQSPIPLNMHKRLSTSGSLQTAVSDAPHSTLDLPTTHCGRIRYSTSVSGPLLYSRSSPRE